MKTKINLAIAGLGLLGTSLAKALLRSPDYRVMVWARRPETRMWAEENLPGAGVFETLPAMLREADMAVLCLPVASAIELFPVCAEHLPAHAVLTDIGSVKQEICSAAAAYPELRFIGSHPMAGTEKSGCEAAFAELYENADIFVVPPAGGEEKDIALCRKMWLDAGAARVEKITAFDHDALVADTSHVLHLLASAMTLSILEAETPEMQRQHFAGCATGFRDTTRIASSNPEMWSGIMRSNAPAVLAALERFEAQMARFKKSIAAGDFAGFEQLFSRGKLLRGAWLGYKKPRPARLVLCGIKHCGKSCTGKALAELLAADFVDSDEALLDFYNDNHPGEEKNSVREIYRTLGEEGFRRLEAETIAIIADNPGAMVTALGGGALSNPFLDLKTLKRLGSVIWLDVPDKTAWERVVANGIPPFLAAAADPETEFIRSNAERRKVFAAAAALTIQPESGESPRDGALRILAALENIG